jgi:hypothetical protein
MEQLEKFIQDNRAAFDTDLPPASVWDAIETQLDTPAKEAKVRRMHLMPWVRRIAAALILLASGIGIGFYLDGGTPGSDLLTLTDISPEHAELETYYQNQVQLRMQQLVNYRQIADVQPDLEQLDEVYQELQRELENAPKGSEERIIQAMIDNYQAKLNILERVLDRVQYTNPATSNPESNEISI